MRLATYLKKNRLSDATFGLKIGAHRTRVWVWRTDRGSPRAKVIAAIEHVTAGLVTAKDFSRAA